MIQKRDNSEFYYYDRELSWLSFNYRVLQEAMDERVPIFERLRFVAIYSSNLEEFFRVRVASLRSIIKLKKKTQKKLDFDPGAVLKEIHRVNQQHQKLIDEIYQEKLLPELRKSNILILDESELDNRQGKFVEEYFNDTVTPWLRPMLVVKNRIAPFMKTNTLYLLIKLISKGNGKKSGEGKKRPSYATLEVPTHHLPRFVEIPARDGYKCVMFVCDIIRYNLDKVFPGYDINESHSATLNRDAELNIDDEYSGNLVQKIKKSIAKRIIGVPSRFLYDQQIPDRTLKYFKEAFAIRSDDLIPGTKYHVLSDFFSFPTFNKRSLEYKKLMPLTHPDLLLDGPLLYQLDNRDHLLHFPYHTYDYIIRFLEEAAADPDVIAIKMTMYRMAENSKIIRTLIRAARAGKEVTAFAEVKARFDELSNIMNAEKLENAGVNVLYSIPGLKVHCKMAIVTKKVGSAIKRYSILSTGNFNEKTALIYSDFALLTSDPKIAAEINTLFKILGGQDVEKEFDELLVAPFYLREDLVKLVDFEIEQAKKGKKAIIRLKMNSLEDRDIIDKLYAASNAGVQIDMVIRGICCLVPGVKGMSENIRVISIVDRFLEHARVFYFYHSGEEKVYLASADFMKRNLSRRIEVGFPVRDINLKKILIKILDIQLNDNQKARVINEDQDNPYVKNDSKENRSQVKIYKYWKKRVSATA